MSRRICISVLLCVRSLSAPLLPGALNSLRRQRLPESQWELILVANEAIANSPGHVPSAVGTRFVVMHEPRRGLLWARLRGLSECRGDYVVLMDDDARLEPDFLASVKRFFTDVPGASVVGGSVKPDPSGYAPPEALRRAFALRAVEETRPAVAAGLTDAPVGVGMVLRREAFGEWATAVRASPWRQHLGRVGSLGGAGEDLDMVATALEAGREVWVSKDLKLRHHIPRERLRPAYVRRLIRVNNIGRLTVLYQHRRLNAPPARRFSRCWSFVLRALSFWYGACRKWDRLVTLEREIAVLLSAPFSGDRPIQKGGPR